MYIYMCMYVHIYMGVSLYMYIYMYVCVYVCRLHVTRFPPASIASHEDPSRREEISLSKMWLQMQVGDSAEVPHD